VKTVAIHLPSLTTVSYTWDQDSLLLGCAGGASGSPWSASKEPGFAAANPAAPNYNHFIWSFFGLNVQLEIPFEKGERIFLYSGTDQTIVLYFKPADISAEV
jgi:hypothetical protein